MNAFVTELRWDPGDLVGFRHRFGAWLEARDVPEAIRDKAIIAVHEAAAGAIEHVVSQQPISIRASVEKGEISIDVRDGPWRPERNGENGHGLFGRLTLIQRLVDKVDVEHGDEGTVIHLRQALF